MSPAQLIVASLALPVAGAAGIALAGRWPNLREGVTLATAVALFACVLGLLPGVLEGALPQLFVLEMLPGIALGFRVEPLGMLFALIASGLWIVNSIYSIGYMRANDEPHQTRFYVCFALSLAATMGIAFASNLMTMFLFYEALTLVTYPLVTHHGDAEARAAGDAALATAVLGERRGERRQGGRRARAGARARGAAAGHGRAQGAAHLRRGAPDPRRHRLHQGLQDPALLPPSEGGRAGLGRRRLPPRVGRRRSFRLGRDWQSIQLSS